MTDLDRIKNRVANLLAKTTENGASQEEALSAISKANDLMMKHQILKSELPELAAKEKCVLKSIDRMKTSFKMMHFVGNLSRLFDCEHFYTKFKVSFFGYKEDVECCLYFYKLITNLAMRERERFFNSDAGKNALLHVHKRTLSANFIKAFIVEISKKLDDLYWHKKSQRNAQERGLILLKEDKVAEEFESMNFNISLKSLKLMVTEQIAWNAGTRYGQEAQLMFGIQESDREEQLKIAQ